MELGVERYGRRILTDVEKTDAWRLHVLIEAGYPATVAERIAARHDVDLHRAVELIEAGCSADLAVEILL
jgi:hypothetical protein